MGRRRARGARRGFPQTVRELALALGLSENEIVYLASNMSNHVSVGEAEIDGKVRVLTRPSRRLKLVQERIAKVLLAVVPLHDSVHGYRRKRSPATAAAPHVGAPFLLGLDIRKYFPHIRYPRVYRLWVELGAPPDLGRLLTMLTTYDCYAPLGFPTSSAIANLVRRRIDARIAGLCRQLGLAYTNYSDNLYTSGAFMSERLAAALRRVVIAEGFPLPQSRVDISGPGRAKRVLGITVNEKLNVRREYRRQVRAAVHQAGARKAGFDSTALQALRGRIGYVASLNSHHGARLAGHLAATAPDRP